MKKHLIIFGLLTICRLNYAQKIHLIMVSDKENLAFGMMHLQNETMLMQIGQTMALTGKSLNPVYINNSNFSASKIKETINTLNIKANDLVFLYYSGGGYFTENNKYPILELKDTKTTPLSLKEISQYIKNKNPHLTIVIADFCSIKSPLLSHRGSRGTTTRKDMRKPVLNQLFSEPCGSLMVSSLSKNQRGLLVSHENKETSIFMSAFAEALAEHLEEFEPDKIAQMSLDGLMEMTQQNIESTLKSAGTPTIMWEHETCIKRN